MVVAKKRNRINSRSKEKELRCIIELADNSGHSMMEIQSTTQANVNQKLQDTTTILLCFF